MAKDREADSLAGTSDRFRRQDYYDAAGERFRQASDALAAHEYGLALMLIGVSIECLLRAFRQPGTPFNSRHDLLDLAVEAAFLPTHNQKQKQVLAAALTELRLVWANNHRYRSEQKLQHYLKRLRRYARAKGTRGALKLAAGSAIENAKIVMAYGVNKWECVNG